MVIFLEIFKIPYYLTTHKKKKIYILYMSGQLYLRISFVSKMSLKQHLDHHDTKTPLKYKLMKFFKGCQGDGPHQCNGVETLRDITPLNKESIFKINN